MGRPVLLASAIMLREKWVRIEREEKFDEEKDEEQRCEREKSRAELSSFTQDKQKRQDKKNKWNMNEHLKDVGQEEGEEEKYTTYYIISYYVT